MPQYGCQKCGSTESTMEIRKATIHAGPNKELQVAGIIPIQRCLNDKCKQITAICNMDIGDLAGLEPVQVVESTPVASNDATQSEPSDDAAKLREQKMAELLEIKAKMAELEGELVEGEPAATDAPPADSSPVVEVPPVSDPPATN